MAGALYGCVFRGTPPLESQVNNLWSIANEPDSNDSARAQASMGIAKMEGFVVDCVTMVSSLQFK